MFKDLSTNGLRRVAAKHHVPVDDMMVLCGSSADDVPAADDDRWVQVAQARELGIFELDNADEQSKVRGPLVQHD